MREILKAIESYLQKTLKTFSKITYWKQQNGIPFFLKSLYDFYLIHIFGRQALLVISKEEDENTPAEIEKHLEEINKIWLGLLIYVHWKLSSYNRDRLVKRGIPFIIPDKQMYLPDFGLDFREQFSKTKEKNRKFLSPATQVVLISALLNDPEKEVFTVELSKRFGYTVMTMNRAFNELHDASIGKVSQRGKGRFWSFSGNKKELWELSKTMMRTPVKSRLWLSQSSLIKNKPMAGLSALSHYTSLNLPSLPIYAMSLLHERGSTILKRDQEGAVAEIEIWSYNPKLFQMEGKVDPFSLCLSLMAAQDERIELALDELIEKFT